MSRRTDKRRRSSPESDQPRPVSSLETVIALTLCIFVALASIALVETDRRISGAILDLPADRDLARAPVSAQQHVGARSARPPLVVLVSVDGLRADRLDVYGYVRDTSPSLRVFAAEAVTFGIVAAQSSQPLTSHKSLHTGKYPSTLLLEETGADLVELASLESPHEFLVDAFVGVKGTLTQGLRAAGYRTAAFTDEGWVSRKAGFADGFEHFDEQPGGLGSALRRACRWLSQTRGASSFLFVQGAEDSCAENVHAAYEALFCTDHAAHADEKQVDRAALSDHYDAGVACADAHLGRLFETLQQLETYDEALIVITSAYGQALGERGVVGHGGLYPEELLVPLMIRFPAGWKVAARRNDEPVELVDVLPTLFAACGVRVPRDLDGTSLLPIVYRGVRGREFLVAQTTFREGPPPVANLAERAILDPGRWHAVHDARTDRLELFALDGDPQAAVPLEDLGRMELPGFLKSFFAPTAEPDVEPEPRRPRARSASTAAVRPSLPPSRP